MVAVISCRRAVRVRGPVGLLHLHVHISDLTIFPNQLHLLRLRLYGSVLLGHTVTAAPVGLALFILVSHAAQAFGCQLEAGVVRGLRRAGVVRGGDLGGVYKELTVTDSIVAVLQVLLLWTAHWYADLRMNTFEDFGAFINYGLHLQKTGSSEETDDIFELQGHMACVAKCEKLLKHLWALDDRDGEAAHGAEGRVVSKVGRAGSEHGLVGAEWLSLDVHDDVTELSLQPQLIQLPQDRAAELRHIKLDVAAVVHFFKILLQFEAVL